MLIFIFILPILIIRGEAANCKPQSSEMQRWGYITVREGAEMFYWSYLDKNYTHRPLVLWLQGGPGIASSGIGNFLEIGPKYMNETEREFAWTKNCSVVFVDSPVGTGFSYVWNQSRLVKTDVSAAKDLVSFLKGLYRKLTDLNNSPLYIFGESYGGKIAAEFALQLTAAIKKKEIYCNFKGLALGDPWLSPATSVENYANFLYANSFIDSVGLAPISSVADLIRKEMSLGHSENATNLFFHLMEPLVTKETNGVNFYNILEDGKNQFFKERNSVSTSILLHEKSKILNLSHVKGGNIIQEMIQFMNGPVKKAIRLPQNATWIAQSNLVFNAMKADFMRSAVDTVDKLLNETSLEVMVYNGQLDLIVPSIGTESWVRQLKWPGIAGWTKTKRQTLLAKNNSTIGYYKKFKNFSFYWILKAGHMVPLDAPSTAHDLLCSFLLEKC